MAESDKRRTLVEGTPDERHAARTKAWKRGLQGRFNRHWLFYAVGLLLALGYMIYLWARP